MSQYNMVVRKRQREQEKQKRRLQIKSASRDHRAGSTSSAGEVPAPLFGPIQKKDGGNELQKIAKDVLGDYQTALRSMEGNDQRKFLGTVDTTPSTPVVPARQNPFESSFRTGAVGTSSSGLAATSSRSSGSRHQVAEPPTSGGGSKKEKSHPHPKHSKAPKSAVPSKPHPGGASTHELSRSAKKNSGSSGTVGSADNTGADVRPTNRLVVSSGSKRNTNRPFRPAPSPNHPGSAPSSKSKTAKSSAGSLAPSDLFKVDTRTERVGTHSYGSNSSSSSKSSKSKRAHRETQSQGSTSFSEPQTHPSSSSSTPSSGHKFSASSAASVFSSTSPSSNVTAPPSSSLQSAHPPHPHKLKKSSTNPSINTLGSSSSSHSSSGKESLETKISLPLRKSGSSDSISSRLLPNPSLAPRPPPPHEEEGEAPTSGPIDIGQLHRMKIESVSAASAGMAPQGHLPSRKKKKKKSKNRPLEEQRTDPMEVERAEVERVMEVKTEPQETVPVPVSALVGKLESVSSPATSVPSHMIRSVTSVPGHMITPVTSVPGHMIMSEDRVMASRMSGMPEASRLSKRPSSIKITSGSVLGVQEVSMDSGEVQNMLEEIMRPVPSLVTPIPTPKKDQSFAFPTRQPPFSGSTKALYSRPLPLATESSQASVSKLKHPGKRPSRLLSSTSSEESDGESKEAVFAAVTTLDSNLAESSESSSSSDSSSSDSESSSEEEGETITPMLEKLNKELPYSASLVTPIKKTPPHVPSMLSAIISPLADDAANLSPPKFASGAFPISTSQENLAYSQPTSVYSQSSSLPASVYSHPASVYSQSSSLPASVYSHPASVYSQSSSLPASVYSHPASVYSQSSSLPASVYSHPASVYSQSSSLPASAYSQATSAHSQPMSIFTSQGFPHVAATAPFASDENAQPGMEESDSDSSSDSENDSGMESDSESSDSEEQSSEDEEEAPKSLNPTPPSTGLGASHHGAEGLLVPFGQSGSSGGFWEDTDFTGGMGATAPLASHAKLGETSSEANQSFVFDTTTQPFDFMATHERAPAHEQRERYDSESGSSARRAKMWLESGRSSQRPDLAGDDPRQSPQHGPAEQPNERNSRKRKQQQQAQQQEEEMSGLESESQPSPPKLPKIRIKIPAPPPVVSPLLSPSVFSENESSSSSDFDEEDGPEDATVAPPKPHTPAALEASAVGAGGVMQGEDGEGKRESWRPLQEEGPNLMMVRIPLMLVDVSREPQKPKATVEPYHVTAPTSKAAKRRTSEAAEHEEAPRRRVSRSDYGRHRDGLDRNSEYSRDYRGHEEERGRPHRDGRSWESPPHERRLLSGSDELPPRGGRRHGRGERGTGEYRERGSSRETWDRERDYHRERTGEQYWPGYEHYDHREFDERRPRYHADNSAQYFLQEARRKKHDADKMRASSVEKAKAYMESVVYFMRHGGALEHDHQAYRMYHDTINMLRCCQPMAGELKPLVALCLRCQSVLYWRMYLLKHTTVHQIQKELQDFFILPKSTQKSPYPSSFSPLPSPASVGSTASASSTSSQDPSPSSAAISVPKHIFNKAAEHLNIATFVTQSCELWKHSDALIEQCRDFFLNLHRKAGRITQFSSIPEVADWVEFGLHSSRWT